ncbi:hypothetical protein CHCC14821_3289 [Bacillus paralicheniformis]|nr:hypothetical protein CHCC14821_3289 [Bacillus paralicheniformis]
MKNGESGKMGTKHDQAAERTAGGRKEPIRKVNEKILNIQLN